MSKVVVLQILSALLGTEVTLVKGLTLKTQSSNNQPPPAERDDGIRVGRNYQQGRKLGQGSFGDIYEGINMETGRSVAIKVERSTTRQPQFERNVLSKCIKIFIKDSKSIHFSILKPVFDKHLKVVLGGKDVSDFTRRRRLKKNLDEIFG